MHLLSTRHLLNAVHVRLLMLLHRNRVFAVLHALHHFSSRRLRIDLSAGRWVRNAALKMNVQVGYARRRWRWIQQRWVSLNRPQLTIPLEVTNLNAGGYYEIKRPRSSRHRQTVRQRCSARVGHPVPAMPPRHASEPSSRLAGKASWKMAAGGHAAAYKTAAAVMGQRAACCWSKRASARWCRVLSWAIREIQIFEYFVTIARTVPQLCFNNSY